MGRSQAIAPPGAWEDSVPDFTVPLSGRALGREDSQDGFWSFMVSFPLPRMDLGISGWVLGFWSRFLGSQVGSGVLGCVFRVLGWILGFQHPQCKVQGGGTVGQTSHGHHVDVGPQKLGEGAQNDPSAGLHCHPGVCGLDLRRRHMQLLAGYRLLAGSTPSPKFGGTLGIWMYNGCYIVQNSPQN